MIPGYKPFSKTHPPATPATPATLNRANGSKVATVAWGQNKNTPDPETVVERAAIMEHDGDVSPRIKANMRASEDYDRRRDKYERANPGGDVAQVEALYQAYLRDWMPAGPDDLPACPPNTKSNRRLWLAWWSKVES